MPEATSTILRARAKWRYRGGQRPAFAEPVGPGQESVWDYPRPPRIESDPRAVRVVCDGVPLAATVRASRVLETASPPTFYLPVEDVHLEQLVEAYERRGSFKERRSFCEWKGEARSWCLAAKGARSQPVAWSYPDPFPEFEAIAGWLAFYPARVECWLGDERVAPQPGGYYGGWLSSELVGPFKGEPGTGSW